MIWHGLSVRQRERLERLKETGFQLCSLPPPLTLRYSADDMVCFRDYQHSRQYVIISRNGADLRRKTFWHERAI